MANELIYKIINNCPITRQRSKVIRPYIESKENSHYSAYGGLHDGVDIEAKSVHSICQGVVLLIGQNKSDNLYEITIQYDANICLRYCNLDTVYVSAGDAVIDGTMVGNAYRFVHFEYINRTQATSPWPVHIGPVTYYKHDSEQLADGSSTLLSSSLTEMEVVQGDREFGPIEITEAMKGEFDVGNRGDDEPAGVGGGKYV